MRDDPITPLDRAILDALHAAGGPVRERVLFERAGGNAQPSTFIAALERLAALGHAHVAFDRDAPGSDPEPFEARMWRAVG
ncbi:MAG: hypothetical protein IT200_03740 [Thermoleophilia bacterium]|nr:hypothetical protein [Thermoleophilia bacterium]